MSVWDTRDDLTPASGCPVAYSMGAHHFNPADSQALRRSLQAAVLAAGRGVRSSVLRLPMYVWGNNGSYFIPLNIAAAKHHGKAHYILPGRSLPLLHDSIPALSSAISLCHLAHPPSMPVSEV